MRILIIECDAEELRANRTVMDNINDALNAFTSSFCGVNNINFAKAMAKAEESEESEDNEDE
jgi:hypothetical protein